MVAHELHMALVNSDEPRLCDGLGQGASELAPLGAAWSLLGKGLPSGFTPCQGLAVLAGIGAALGA